MARNAHCDLGAFAGVGALACIRYPTASNSAPGGSVGPPSWPESARVTRGVGIGARRALASAARVRGIHRVARVVASSKDPSAKARAHVKSLTANTEPSVIVAIKSSGRSYAVSSAAPVGPATDRAPGASFRTPETRSLVARRTSRSRKPLARSIPRASSSETTSRDPTPQAPPSIFILSTSASRARSHRSLASASARSPRRVRAPVALSVSIHVPGYTRSTYTTANAHAPPSGRSVRSGTATRRLRAPSFASHLAGLTPLKCNARWTSFAALESGGTGSSPPRSSAPCTSTLAPICSPGCPRRRSAVSWASSAASTPYQPSVSSRRARPLLRPLLLTAATHKTAGAFAGVSRSNTRRTQGRSARKISRSYR
mmetsp:Transcript_6493/g.26414  ORF Transcript_6493/g.26414 Transcript_6493/m.26414 type:complete len:372 (-) Transcript_6493:394-1509(-)